MMYTRMKPDQLQLGFLKVLKGSLMQKEAEVYGIVYKRKRTICKCFTNEHGLPMEKF